MRPLVSGAIAAIVVATAVASTPAAQAPRAYSVAVVRRDGGLLPIGTFNGRRWDVSWPWESIDQLEIPITLDAVPRSWWGKLGRRDDWQLWTEGVPGQTIHLVGPRVIPVMCTPRMALSTDYRGADAPPLTEQPYPKAGLAVSPPVAVGRIEILDAAAPERTAIGPALKQAFDDEEDRLAAEWVRANDPHPFSRKERLATPLTIEAMYATGIKPDRLYYVEASRKYDHSNEEKPMCGVAFGSAFLRTEGATVRALGGEIRVVPCDRRGLVYMLPFGELRPDGRTFWVTQVSGWDLERYNIVEFKRSRVEIVASTFGGRCEAGTQN